MKSELSQTPLPSLNSKPSLENEDWENAHFSTLKTNAAFLFRIRFIQKRQEAESWLPSRLRTQIQGVCQTLIEQDKAQPLKPSDAQRGVEQLAILAFRYNHLTLKSSTLCQIRALDMELNERNYLDSRDPNSTYRPVLSA